MPPFESKPGIHGLAFQCQNAKHTLMHHAQRMPSATWLRIAKTRSTLSTALRRRYSAEYSRPARPEATTQLKPTLQLGGGSYCFPGSPLGKYLSAQRAKPLFPPTSYCSADARR